MRLRSEEQAELKRLPLQGAIQVRKLNRAKIPLLADENHVIGR